MTDHDTTPGAPETEALAADLSDLIFAASRVQVPGRWERHAADAVIAAGWISPTEAATRDAAQRAAGAELVERMCHWTQGLAPDETHEAFHFGHHCPYDAAGAVLRGEPDPRERADRIGGAS